ncbi:MAG: Yip1 family protein [Phycisphaerae bacterium]|jgi:hypothetical protein
MESETTETLPTVDAKEAMKARRAGGSCITLFVVFLVTLLSFGKAPWGITAGEHGRRLDFNLISCLGVVVGIYGIIFLATGLKRVLRLSSAKKVLGLVGGIGLAVHLVLALFSPLNYGLAKPAGTGGNGVLGQTGPEQWTIDGKTYHVSSTYYLTLQDGLQYTIEYPYQFTAADGQMDDKHAIDIAFPLMKYAVQSGTYRHMHKVDEGPVDPPQIGVALVEQAQGGARGYRVSLSVAEIKRRIEQSAITP